MNDTITLRDHSKPCEHEEAIVVRNLYPPLVGEPEINFDSMWRCENRWCPGGRERAFRQADALELYEDGSLDEIPMVVWVEADDE